MIRSGIDRRLWRVAALVTASLAVALGAAAQTAPAATRVETLRWVHPDVSEVAAFRIHWGIQAGAYLATIDAGVPTPSPSGVYSAAITVPETATVYVALSAVGTNGLESIHSNVGVRPPPTTSTTLGAPGQPTPE